MPHNEAVPGQLEDVPWPVKTARLTLRRATVEDADAVLSYRRLSPVADWLGAPTEDFSARFAASERLDVLLVVERHGAVIGDLMVKLSDAWAPPAMQPRARGVQAELGWSLHPDETGRGYATEAVEEVLRICFEELGLRRVTASCFAGNTASYRLMERVGMRRETTTRRDALHPTGEWMDGYGYALLAEEWRHRRAAGEVVERSESRRGDLNP